MRVTGKAAEYVSPSDPPLLGTLFASPSFAWIWLVVRVFLGWQWLHAGWEKLHNPGWTQSGTALKGFWTSAVAVPATGKAPITYEWYRAFLSGLLEGGHYTWFAKLIVFGELAIGIALILGAFVGIAAFFGGFMNMNFMLAGSASTNPVLFTLAVLLILAWKVGGYWGLDRWLLQWIRTPWEWVDSRRVQPQPQPATPSQASSPGVS